MMFTAGSGDASFVWECFARALLRISRYRFVMLPASEIGSWGQGANPRHLLHLPNACTQAIPLPNIPLPNPKPHIRSQATVPGCLESPIPETSSPSSPPLGESFCVPLRPFLRGNRVRRMRAGDKYSTPPPPSQRPNSGHSFAQHSFAKTKNLTFAQKPPCQDAWKARCQKPPAPLLRLLVSLFCVPLRPFLRFKLRSIHARVVLHTPDEAGKK